jgi:hypothetical protein
VEVVVVAEQAQSLVLTELVNVMAIMIIQQQVMAGED